VHHRTRIRDNIKNVTKSFIIFKRARARTVKTEMKMKVSIDIAPVTRTRVASQVAFLMKRDCGLHKKVEKGV